MHVTSGFTLSSDVWGVGTLLMLSAYFSTTGAPTGNLVADIAFYSDAGVTLISTARAVLVMSGAAQSISRVYTAPTAVPAGTVQVRVRVLVDGASLNIPVGATLTVDHLLLEIPASGQTLPSIWADLDANGKVEDIFTLGSSSSLRAQGSTLPVLSGTFPFTYTDTTITNRGANRDSDARLARHSQRWDLRVCRPAAGSDCGRRGARPDGQRDHRPDA